MIIQWLPAMLTLLLMICGPFLELAVEDPDLNVVQYEISNIEGCVQADVDAPRWSVLDTPEKRIKEVFWCEGVLLSVDVATYLRQSQGKEAITDTNVIVDTEYVSAAAAQILERDGLEVREYVIDRGQPKGFAWSWYVVGNEPHASALEAKLAEFLNAMVLRKVPVRIYTITSWTDERSVATDVLSRSIGVVRSSFSADIER